ncbi:unnamed protein product [Cuscuta campestris]|uniref:Uncharacterized protein n=1 Tax=Cuscuta campestris TaxID=132261 RepID=A0A484N9K9_9ASTE|nr:unnamed protein product [Cuscuta campestris]
MNFTQFLAISRNCEITSSNPVCFSTPSISSELVVEFLPNITFVEKLSSYASFLVISSRSTIPKQYTSLLKGLKLSGHSKTLSETLKLEVVVSPLEFKTLASQNFDIFGSKSRSSSMHLEHKPLCTTFK